MKKTTLIIILLFLILSTSFVKNSTKEIDKKIFVLNEKITVLNNQYELEKLEFNYLSSPKNLRSFQDIYFENQFKEIDLNKINKLIIKDNKIYIKKLDYE